MRKLLLALCLSAALLPQISSAQNSSEAAREAIPDGELHPETISVENSVLDAVLLLDAGELSGARTILDSLERSCPPDPAVQYYLGMCSYMGRDIGGAISHFEQASALDTTNIWYRETLANLYVSVGETTKAGEVFSVLSKEDPARFRNGLTLAMMADAYRMKRDYDSMFSTLEEIVYSEDTDEELKYRSLLNALGNFDSRTLNQILPRIDSLMYKFTLAEPGSINAHQLHMETSSMMENHQAVIDECYALMALQPGDTLATVTSLSIIGDTYHQMGDTRKAFKTYEKALKIKPDYCPVLNNYAYFLSQKKSKLRKAEKMSRITVEAEPDNATYLDTYGWILFLRGKASEAKPYFKHAMLYGGKDSAVVLMHYSLVLKALGEDDLATYYKNLAENKNK